MRLAQPRDAARMAALDASASPYPWSASQYRPACTGLATNPERGLMLERGPELLGFIVFAQVLDEASIHNIVVAVSARRQGFGAQLLEAVLAELARDRVRCCQLEVRRSNTAARRLYAALGFTVDGTRKNYYPLPGGREDAILMSRDI